MFEEPHPLSASPTSPSKRGGQASKVTLYACLPRFEGGGTPVRCSGGCIYFWEVNYRVGVDSISTHLTNETYLGRPQVVPTWVKRFDENMRVLCGFVGTTCGRPY